MNDNNMSFFSESDPSTIINTSNAQAIAENPIKYTKDIQPQQQLTRQDIASEDIVLLNGDNIVGSISAGDKYKGINPIPSYDLVKDLSTTVSGDINTVKSTYVKLSSNIKQTMSGDISITGNIDVNGNLSISPNYSISATKIVATSLSATSIINASSLTGISGQFDNLSATKLLSTSHLSTDSSYSKSLSATNLSTDKAVVTSSLYADFDKIFNTKDVFLSDLHSTDQISTWNNAARMVNEILVESGIDRAGIDYSNYNSLSPNALVGTYIKTKIINGKSTELFGCNIENANVNDQLRQFYYKDINKMTANEVVENLQLVLNRLKTQPYSLQQKLQIIENSIDGLENNLQEQIDTSKTSAENIINSIDGMSADYRLSGNNGLSIVTAMKQTSGQIDLSTALLAVDDIDGISALSSTLKKDAEKKYVPLSGNQTISNSLSIDGSLSVGKNIVANGNTGELCISDSKHVYFTDISDNDNTLSAFLSSQLESTKSSLAQTLQCHFDWQNMCLSVSLGETSTSVDVSRLIESRMIQNVTISSNDQNEPILSIVFKGDSSTDDFPISVSLGSLIPLYTGGTGISIDEKWNNGKRAISIDESVATKKYTSTEISSKIKNTLDNLQVVNQQLTSNYGNYIVNAVSQLNDQIYILSTKIDDSQALKNLIDDKTTDIRKYVNELSGDNGIISSLNSTAKISIDNVLTRLASTIEGITCNFNDSNFHSDSNEIKILTRVTQTSGIVEVGTKVLNYNEISGLSNALSDKLSRSAGGIVQGQLSINSDLSVNKSLLVRGAGINLDESTNGGVAIGRNAILSNEEAFVWDGGIENASKYGSHGQHTFSINPCSGISGFYIGESTLDEIINQKIEAMLEESDAKVKTLYNGIKDVLDECGITETTTYNDLSCDNAYNYLIKLKNKLYDADFKKSIGIVDGQTT